MHHHHQFVHLFLRLSLVRVVLAEAAMRRQGPVVANIVSTTATVAVDGKEQVAAAALVATAALLP